MIRRVAVAVAAALLLTSCTTKTPTPKPSPSPSPSASPEASTSPAPVQCPELRGGSQTSLQLRSIRTAHQADSDRVVFEFTVNRGPSDAPAYILRQTAPPFTQDPSDQPMTVDGNAFFQIVMMGASGVDLSGSTPNMTYTGPKTINANLPTLLQLVEQGDFEATLSWIFGLNHNACPTVTVLQSPLRLVIDFPA